MSPLRGFHARLAAVTSGATGKGRVAMDMAIFWMTAGGMVALVAALLLLGLRRGAALEAGEPEALKDVQVYRVQLSEIERDIARGQIEAEEGQRLKTEVSRRLLEADRKLQADTRAPVVTAGGVSMLATGVIVVALAGSVWAYMQMGAPGLPDQPMAQRIAEAERLRAARPSQEVAEAAQPAPTLPEGADANYLNLMQQLRAKVAENPEDIVGQQLLAQNEAKLGNYAAARKAMAQVVALKAPADTADDHATLAELMVMAAGGTVTPEAEAALAEALARDPKNGTASYYLGIMEVQLGRPDRGFQIWRALIERARPGEPWTEPLHAQIGDMAAAAGVRYTPPAMANAAGPGPSASDMEAAASMTPEERQQMIAGMVSQLSERLAAEGGPAEDWAKLINAYGVMGNTDSARAIWTEAQSRFADRPDELEMIRAAALQAGVAE